MQFIPSTLLMQKVEVGLLCAEGRAGGERLNKILEAELTRGGYICGFAAVTGSIACARPDKTGHLLSS